MLKPFYPRFVGGPGAVGLLAVRVVVGAAFILHGWPKIQAPTAWMPESAGVPGALQALAAVGEFGGGIALIFGALTPVAAILLVGTMVGALAMVHFPHGDPFVNPNPKVHQETWELAAVYLAINVLFLTVGPGKLSVDALLFDKQG